MSAVVLALDLDGTIEDSRDDMVAAVLRVRAGRGLAAMPDATVRPHVNAGMDHLYRQCFPELAAAAAREAYEADYLANIARSTRLYPGMDAALAELARLGNLACVTNKPERLSVALLTALGVGPLFSAVIGGDTCPEGKPSPLPLAEAVRRCAPAGAAPRVVMIGDTAGDVRCGRAYGAQTVWCAWGYVAGPGEILPDATAAAPRELPGVIGRLLAAPTLA